jgi:hypothetical protein
MSRADGVSKHYPEHRYAEGVIADADGIFRAPRGLCLLGEFEKTD